MDLPGREIVVFGVILAGVPGADFVEAFDVAFS